MLEGRIRELDVRARKAVIEATDGKEYAVHFPEDAIIEVSELETVGTMGGDLEDLEVGYLVEFEVKDLQADGSCACMDLASIS